MAAFALEPAEDSESVLLVDDTLESAPAAWAFMRSLEGCQLSELRNGERTFRDPREETVGIMGVGYVSAFRAGVRTYYEWRSL